MLFLRKCIFELFVNRGFIVLSFFFFFYVNIVFMWKILGGDHHLCAVLIIHIHVHHQEVVLPLTEVEDLVQDLILEEDIKILAM